MKPTKYATALVIILSVLMSDTVLAADCPIGTPEITVFYINGILSDDGKAEFSRMRLEEEFEKLPGNPVPLGCIEFKVVYNTNQNLFLDLFESTLQKLGIDPSIFWILLRGTSALDTFTQIVIDTFAQIILDSYITSVDLGEHIHYTIQSFFSEGEK